jgi:hypothetical protein
MIVLIDEEVKLVSFGKNQKKHAITLDEDPIWELSNPLFASLTVNEDKTIIIKGLQEGNCAVSCSIGSITKTLNLEIVSSKLIELEIVPVN